MRQFDRSRLICRIRQTKFAYVKMPTYHKLLDVNIYYFWLLLCAQMETVCLNRVLDIRDIIHLTKLIRKKLNIFMSTNIRQRRVTTM